MQASGNTAPISKLPSRLRELGLVLPKSPTPLGAYVEASGTGSVLFLSGMLPVANGKLAITGRLGENLSVEQGRETRNKRLTNQAPPLFLLGGPVGRRGFLLSGSQGLDPLVLGKAPSALRQLHPTFVMSHKICELASPRGKAPWGEFEPGCVTTSRTLAIRARNRCPPS
jgi:hypothetical protein